MCVCVEYCMRGELSRESGCGCGFARLEAGCRGSGWALRSLFRLDSPRFASPVCLRRRFPRRVVLECGLRDALACRCAVGLAVRCAGARQTFRRVGRRVVALLFFRSCCCCWRISFDSCNVDELSAFPSRRELLCLLDVNSYLVCCAALRAWLWCAIPRCVCVSAR